MGAGPESLERVPESLARVTELLWRPALEEARERLKTLAEPDASTNALLPLQEQVMKLSVALAEARATEGEQLTHLTDLSRERDALRVDRGSLLALLKSTQTLLEQQNARVAALEGSRRKEFSAPAKNSSRSRPAKRKSVRHKLRRVYLRKSAPLQKRTKVRKPK